MTDTVLKIQNVTQVMGVDSPTLVKRAAKRLKDMIIEQKEEKLPNGTIKLTLILDPKIQGVKNGKVCPERDD